MTHSEKTKARKTHMPVFKKSLLAVCIVAATQQGARAADVETEEVIVTGIRASLEKAQEIKRNADTVKDVVTASDISALPDKSVVEAIARVPGVSIERFAAPNDPDHFSVEGSGAVVRGLNRVRSEFNGRDTFSANKSSGLNFSDVPAELMGGVEVVKNLTADLIEGGVAGTINLKTRKPFDKKELQIAGTVKATYADKIEKTEPDVSGLISNVWDTDAGEFGALLNISNSTFSSRSEGIQLFNWYERGEAGYLIGANGKPVQECPDWANCNVNNDGVVEYPWGGAVPNKQDPTKGIGLPYDNAPSSNGKNKNTYFAPAGVALRQQDNERDRTGFASSLQWENPDDTILATLEFDRSDSDLAWNERFVEYNDEPFKPDTWKKTQFADQKETDGTPSARSSFVNSFAPVTIGGRDGGWFTHGTLTKTPYATGVRRHEETSTINDLSFNLKFKPTDQLTLVTDLQYIKADSTVNDVTVYTASDTREPKVDPDPKKNVIGHSEPDVYVDLRGSIPRIEFLGYKPVEGKESSLRDPARTILRSAMDHLEDNEGDSKALSFDATYDIDSGWLKSAKAGFRVSDKTQNRKVSAWNWGNISQEWNDTAKTCADNPGFCERYDLTGSFFDGKSLGGETAFWFPNANLLSMGTQAFSDALDHGADGKPIRASGGADIWYPLNDKRRNRTGAANNPIAGTPYLPSEIYEVNEKRQAIYGMLTFENTDLPVQIKGNVGARYVKYQLESTGSFVVQPADAKYLDVANWGGKEANILIPPADRDLMKASVVLPGTITPEDYTKVLPSLNLSFGITDDLIVRFAASEAIWLPDLDNVRYNNILAQNPNVSDVDPNKSGNQYASYGGLEYESRDVGNPYLKPETSVNLDLTAEWYFSELGSLTFSLFNKDISDLIRRAPVTETYNGKPYHYTHWANTSDAKISGFEIAYQQTFDFLPGYWSGLGTQANYTYVDAKQTTESAASSSEAKYSFRWFTDLPLDGLSKDTANLVLFYEKESISTRLAYNWRSDYLLNSRDVIAMSPIYNKANGQLDFSFRYNLSENYKVGFEANNLLNTVTETELQFNQDGVRTPRSYFNNDKRYSLVVSGAF
ncbi:MAG: TonB-dependent receptor [Marinagarivorans sp.]